MRFELTTSTLARLHSTPELHPHYLLCKRIILKLLLLARLFLNYLFFALLSAFIKAFLSKSSDKIIPFGASGPNIILNGTPTRP